MIPGGAIVSGTKFQAVSGLTPQCLGTRTLHRTGKRSPVPGMDAQREAGFGQVSFSEVRLAPGKFLFTARYSLCTFWKARQIFHK